MRGVSRKMMLVGVLAVAAVAGFYLMKEDSKLKIKLANLKEASYAKVFQPDCPDVGDVDNSTGPLHPISMLESSGLLGEVIGTKTFSLSVADVNADGKDDILVGAHERNPYLYINADTGFTNQSAALFNAPYNHDRHGYTFADMDNDGDLDLAIAAGGDDGVGKGAANMFLKNETENGVVHYTKQEVSPEMLVPPSRSRSLIPIASPDGKSIDLYLATLARDGYPNKLFSNTRHKDKFEFGMKDDFFPVSVNDHGRGVVADYDGDGNYDYLVVQDSTLMLYWHPTSSRDPSVISYGAYSTSVGDFNNDGLLDIFLGSSSPLSKSDNLAYTPYQLNFVLQNNGPGDTSSITFKSQSPKLDFNLDQHIPATQARPFAGPRDIFLGRDNANPKSRIFAVDKEMAEGEPAFFDQPGIYIWHSTASAQWNMKWVFFDELNQFKGSISGTGISDVAKNGFTINKPALTTDTFFINNGDGKFTKLCPALAQHHGTTSDSTVADFNNDGWLDIIGLHQQEQGLADGEIFVLTNNAGISFTPGNIDVRERDKMQRADLIAHGFFNEDNQPDVVFTHGFGQTPGNQGAPRLMLNSTSDYQALLVNLVGSSANKFAIGAKLTLTDANDAMMGYRVHGLNSNIHQNTHWIHFGLGEFTSPYQLKIEWPDGKVTSHPFSEPGRHEVKQ